MKPRVLTFTAVAAVLTIATHTQAQTTAAADADTRTFEITPAAVPDGAGDFKLVNIDLADMQSGNAASSYLRAAFLVGSDQQTKVEAAIKSFNAGDHATFDTQSKALLNRGLRNQLELAASYDRCDWQLPLREEGMLAPLPEISPIAHEMTGFIRVWALRDIDTGNLSDAIHTLHLGYSLADNLGCHRTLIGGRISANITHQMDEIVMALITRKDAPNLFWALSEISPRRNILSASLASVRLSSASGSSLKLLTRARAGDPLTGAEWMEAARGVQAYALADPKETPTPSPTMEERDQFLARARVDYAAVHHVSPAEAARADLNIVFGEFSFRRYEGAIEDVLKLRGLAYPPLLAQSHDLAAKYASEKHNAFMEGALSTDIDGLHDYVMAFARVDRELAAMQAVEGIRAYAAGNQGKLPSHLADIERTPVPDNPMTGKPFDYVVKADVATLSDPQSEVTLVYTIRMRH